MCKKMVPLLIVAALLVPAINANAEADKKSKGGFVGVGARFAWTNYKTPVLAYSHDPGEAMEAYGGPNLTGEFHWGVVRQFVLSLGLDFSFFQHTVFPYPDPEDGDNDDIDSETKSVKASFFTFGALIGGKLYLWKPEPGKAVLTLHLGVGKYFSTAGNTAKLPFEPTTDDEDADYILKKKVKMISDLGSPFVIQFAVGAEFFATDSFSLGADILGIRFAYASTDEGIGEELTYSDATWTGEQKMLSLYVYSAITLNFSLADTGSGKRKKKVQEEADWGTGGWTPDETKADSWGETDNQPKPAPQPQPQPQAQPQPQPQPGYNTQPGYQPPPPPPPAEGNDNWSDSLPPPPPPAPAPEPLPPKKKKKAKAKPRKAAGPSEEPPPPPPPGY